MTRPIRVSIPHSLGKDEARRRLKHGLATLPQQVFGGFMRMATFRSAWLGDRMDFEGGMLGQRISGRIHVEADAVLLEVDLPEMLAALADRLVGVLRRETQKLLEKK